MLTALLFLSITTALAQSTLPQRSEGVTIQGSVLDSDGKPAIDAVVRLESKGSQGTVEMKTNAAGAFSFSALGAGSYTLSAEKSGLHSRAVAVTASSPQDGEHIDLVLENSGVVPKAPGAASSTDVMEFADKPNFTVAGVTDWTAVGGHGSDSSLRTSEDLTRETLALKPDSPGYGTAGFADSGRKAADAHRLAGERDEKLGDPLSAVHEYEQAVSLNPSEENYFEWGSELLLHRAVWQAQEVFQKGAKAYPKSARMLTALGAALFGGARYDEAALRLCDASDLNPPETEPYIFMGKIEMAAPDPLPCVERKLAAFVEQQPGNSLANYFYAMAILKRYEHAPDEKATQQAEALLTKAVNLDGKCADAYLELGVLSSSQRNFEKAIGFYTKAIEANPQLGEAHYRLGVAYDRIGETEKAKQEFQLHDEIKKLDTDAIDRQRKEVKQFLVVLRGQPADPPVR